MPPRDIPFVMTIACLTRPSEHSQPLLQDLIRTNLGPLLGAGDGDRVTCAREGDRALACTVYAPWKTSCACCSQLADTLTSNVASELLDARVVGVDVDCTLPARYRPCEQGYAR